MKFSNKTYDILKWIAQIALPALGTLYFALCSVWELPYGEQVIGTVTAVDVFLGAILGISSSNYSTSVAEGSEGVLRIDTENALANVQIDVSDIDALLQKKVVSLRVDPNAKLRQDQA